jgi:F-type H+-transporting ATPase subunit gamma
VASGRERVLRRRIRSIEATKKITHAMELIAASQIVRAQNRIARNRPYVSGLREAFRITVDDATEPTRLVGEPQETGRVALLVAVSDRGLAGAYNANVLREADRRLASIERDRGEATLVTVGRRAESYFRFRRRPIAKTFQKVSERPSFDAARKVSAEVIGPFMSDDVDIVEIISTRFVSAGLQVVENRRLLPVPESEGELGDDERSGASAGFYDFEPRSDDLLSSLVPQLVEAEIFGALLEAAASEHTARQRAMAAATDNADELSKTLRREMNRVRQDAITSEIMEIVGGAEALRGAGATEHYDLTLGIDYEEPNP